MAYECVSHICSAICSCLLGFNFRQEQRPTTLQIQTSSVTTNTEIIPSSASSVTNTTEITPPPPSSVATDTEIIPPSASSVTTTITEVIPPPPSSPLATSSTSLSSSSSAPSGKLTYDVFLSFRGTDTRNKFTDHLYTALVQKGIHTFRDDEELESGDSIGPTLLKAIKDSRYVIVVLSQSYADSAWCLDELAKVIECKKTMGQIVIPVFYDVHPFEVRRQKVDRFNQAFEKHQKRNPDKLKRWKDALFEVSNISGWHLDNRSEAKVIQGIVKSVSIELNKIISISEGLVGMDSHLDKMLSYLDIPCHDDVRIIGICGMGGVGKSTIAEVLFNRIKVQFEGASFLSNVRERMEKQGTVQLQKQLLSDLLTRNVDVDNIEMGKNTMRERLKTKRVLIILDDVDSAEQLEVLCDRRWYGLGSRIIITTRNVHLHIVVEGDRVYNVDPLSDYEALQLFKMEAFKKDELVEDEYLKLSKEFVKYTGGLPLAIKVLGASVKGRNADLWLSTLVRLKKNPDQKIMNVLKVSFDGLTKTEKSIFLDIACFLKGTSLDRVRRILQGSDALCPDLDLEVLQEKYMVVLFGKKLWMHDLIQEMGREVVREKYPEEPEKRSRLWIRDEILEVFDENKATGAIQSILLQGPTKDDVDPNDTFSKMTKLRLLKISNVNFSGDIKYLSKKLQFLYWDECPLNSFPEKFQPDYLVELHMRSSCIKQLWTGERGWSMLQYINLTGSQYLMSTPDFTEVPELETLVLQDCTNLVEIHPSFGFLKKLKHLDLRNCKSIESIPPFIALESLEMLLLSFCSGLKTFPEIVGNMKSSLHLHLDGTNIEELPPSIERLTGLTMLNLKDSKNLLRLPNTIRYLTSMKYLNLTGCSKLDAIAENLNGMECLGTLVISGTSISELSFIVGMKNLQFLSCKGCKCLVPESFRGLASSSLTELDLSYCDLWDGAFLNDLVTLTTLRQLRLSGNCFVRLPENISGLSKLESLELNNCRQLQLLPKKLPSSLVYVYARDCTSLTDYPNQIKALTSSKVGVTTLDSRHSAKCSAADSSENGEGFKHHGHHPLQSPRQMETTKKTNLVFAEDEIPEWFGSISTRNEISIPIPGNLITDYKWKGFAACAIFTVEGHTALSVIQPDPDFSNYSYQMTLETDVMSLGPEVLLMNDHSRSLSFGSVSHLLLIFYMSRSAVPQGALYEASELRATFETTNPSIVVQKCAIRLVYDEDEGWSSKVHPRSGWGRQIDEDAYVLGSTDWFNHSLKREKFFPPSEEESTVLLRKNLEFVLPRYLEAVNNVTMFRFHLSGSPGWFHKEPTFVVPKSTRSRSLLTASIKLPENLHKSKKWMGFAIFTSLVHEVGQKNEEEKFWVFVELGNEEDKLTSVFSSPELERARQLSEEYHQLLVFDIPRARIPETLFTQTEMDHLGITIVGSPLVKVQRFGFRIVYQEDIQGFSDTIIRCIQREGSLQACDKFFVKEWIQLIRLHGARIERMTERDSRTPRQKYIDLHSQKYRKFWDWSDPACSFSCGFERTEISKWKRFMPSITKGNSTECRLPLNVFDDDNWLGFAVCSWLSHDQYPNISLGSALDSENVLLEIRLHSDVELDCLFDFKIQMVLGELKLTLFHYLRRTVIHSKIWRLWKLVRVTIRVIDYPCLTVHSCAIRLLYKEDIEDLVETLTLAELP